VVKVPYVFFTHCHADHMAGVITHAALRMQKGWDRPWYYVPEEKVEAFKAFMDGWTRLVDELPYVVQAVKPGFVFPVVGGGYVKAFRAIHTTPTVGYALCRKVKRLKAELTGKTGPEIAALARNGVEVNEEFERVSLAFCGDTNIDVLDDPVVKEAESLILECTFLDDSVSPEQAYKGGHIHIQHILDNLDKLDGKKVLFTHASQRYSKEDIRAMMRRKIPGFEPRGFDVLNPADEWKV
jgi:ribonuclease Z